MENLKYNPGKGYKMAMKGGKRTWRPRKKAAKKAKARATNTDVVKAIVKCTGTWGPQAGNTNVSNFVYSYWSPSGTYLNPIQSNPVFGQNEFKMYLNMYDQYRVTGVRVKLIPRVKTLEGTAFLQAQNATDATGVISGKNVVYSVIDRDSIAPSSVISLQRYSSMRKHNIFKTISRSYSVKYGNNVWFDCQDPAGMDDVQRSLGLHGGVTIYGESLPQILGQKPPYPPWWDVEVSYYCVFRGKSLVSLSTDASGNVTIGRYFPVSIGDPNPATDTILDTDRTGAIDLSGNRQ